MIAAALFLASLMLHFGASGTLEGVVTDRSSGEPVSYAYLHLEEINRTTTTDREGRFSFGSLPEGTFTLSIHRIGYQDADVRVTVSKDQALVLDVGLVPEVLQGEDVVVTGADVRSGGGLEEVSAKLSGNELRLNMGPTLGETLRRLPGFDVRTMGAATARPVVRGLGGERVLLLSDGQRSGDVSASSADHAVTIDPMNADEIEIARGPSALLYGSNTLGGVINVVQNRIPTSRPERLGGSATVQALTATPGGSGSVRVDMPVGALALRADWSMKAGGDLRTPAGVVENTSYVTRSGWVPSLGMSLIRPWGFAGLSSSTFSSRYGIPPDPLGGHPDGVDVEMLRWNLDGRSEIHVRDRNVTLVSLAYSLNRYNHKEIESGGSIGTEFGQISTDLTLKARHRPRSEAFESAVSGLWLEAVDLAVYGAGTPDTRQYSAAAFRLEKAAFGAVSLEAAARGGVTVLDPAVDDPDSRIGWIRRRTFPTLAAAVTLGWRLGTDWSTGWTLMKTARAPSIEESFSLGPHLAAYSYEIGNPELSPENAYSGEWFVRYEGERFSFKGIAFGSWFETYLYARNTGVRNLRFPSLYDYQYSGTRAWMRGLEWTGSLMVTPSMTLEGGGSWVVGDRRGGIPPAGAGWGSESDAAEAMSGEGWTPLPMMPPARGSLRVTWTGGALMLEGGVTGVATQSRLGEFETRTTGHALVDAAAQMRFFTGGVLHTLSLKAENLADQRVYDHLSRIKDLYPGAGRSASLLYRVYF